MSKTSIWQTLDDGTTVRYLGPDLYGMVRIYSNVDGNGTIVDTVMLPKLIETLHEVYMESVKDRIEQVGTGNSGKHKNNWQRWTPVTNHLPPSYEPVLVYGLTWHNFGFMQVSKIDKDGKWELYGHKNSTVLAWSWLPDMPSKKQVSRWLEEKEPAG